MRCGDLSLVLVGTVGWLGRGRSLSSALIVLAIARQLTLKQEATPHFENNFAKCALHIKNFGKL